MKPEKIISLPRSVATLLIAIACHAPGMIAQTTEPTGQSTIRVQAIYQDTERPVRRAEVQLFSQDVPDGSYKKLLGPAWFMLVPKDELRWARRESFIFGYTDKQGAFKVTGAPGEYILMMLRRNEEPVVLVDYVKEHTTGPRVTLKPGEQASVEIVVPAH